MRTSKRTARAARYLFRLCLDSGQLDVARVRQVAQHLATSGRRRSIGLLTAFERLVRLYRDRHTAVVESAVALTDAERQGVTAGLARVYGAALEATFAENEALIGGMRIKVGSDVYDGSVRAKLAALEARL
jgi:F-type H+-transporting ATPase subunit delta